MPAVLGQYCINVSDLERSITFWEEVVGIPVASRTDIPGAKEAVIQAPAGGSRLQLAQHLDHDGPIDIGGGLWKLYIVTDECAALHDRIVATGCESVMAPTDLDQWPVTMAYVKDPDGYLVELLEYHDAPPAGVPDPKKIATEAR